VCVDHHIDVIDFKVGQSFGEPQVFTTTIWVDSSEIEVTPFSKGISFSNDGTVAASIETSPGAGDRIEPVSKKYDSP
jgi:hypothetical protein